MIRILCGFLFASSLYASEPSNPDLDAVLSQWKARRLDVLIAHWGKPSGVERRQSGTVAVIYRRPGSVLGAPLHDPERPSFVLAHAIIPENCSVIVWVDVYDVIISMIYAGNGC